MRLAIGRLSHETNALSPEPTELSAFSRFHWRRGADLLAGCRPWRKEASQRALYNAELSGAWTAARLAGVEVVPLTSAWAIPSGKLAPAAFEHLRDELLDHLRAALPVDGVLLVLHGAMGVYDHPDPEGEILARVREIVGPDVKIGVVYDLHAIVRPSKIDPVDLVAGYRTNPHRDHFRIGLTTTRTLVRAMRHEVRPVTRWRSLPMVIGGAPTIDFLSPMRPIFRRMRAMERDPRVLSVSIFQNQLWHDAPDAGWASLVITDDDAALADQLADELADRLWATRHALPDEVPDASEAIESARRSRWARVLGTVCLSDLSDSVGCGSVGENTHLLRELLGAKDLRAFAPIRDAEAVERYWQRPAGEPFAAELGGRLAPGWCEPLEVRGQLVRSVDTGLWGRALVVDCGHLQLVVTEHAPMTVSPSFYRKLGLEPLRADVVVVKSLFMFRLYFLRENRRTLYARTRGMTDLDVWRDITYDRPVHPKDPVDHWRG